VSADSVQFENRTSFAVCDLVASLDTGMSGRVIAINYGGVLTEVFVRWEDSSNSAVSVFRLRRQ
jgi:hypothetical protein